MKHILLLLVLVVFPVIGTSQTNYGKEFYAVFAKNQGGGSGNLTLYLFGNKATMARVEVPALSFRDDVDINPGAITTVELPNNTGVSSVELLTFSTPLPGMAVHITSPDDISVIALNAKDLSADAFLLYPVSVAGTRYRVLSFPNSPIPSARTSSLLTIASLNDNTQVTVTPTAALTSGEPAGSTLSVTLSKGSVIQVGANPLDTLDLTETTVRATKPIIMFSGHERTEIPHGFKQAGSSSREHLYEQLIPDTILGTIFHCVPYHPRVKNAPVIRVLATEPQTIITINNSTLVLNPGKLFETALSVPVKITASYPVSVGQYMHSGSTDAPNEDPSLALILPVQHYTKEVSFISVPNPVFTQHFITIVAESVAPAIEIDGVRLPSHVYQMGWDSAFAYVSMEMAAGLHTITSDVPVNAIAYGSGEVTAYSYNTGFGGAGMSSVPVNTQPAHGGKFGASTNSARYLVLHSLHTEVARLRATLYDILGRQLYPQSDIIELAAQQTLTTTYTVPNSPAYVLLQEYSVSGKPIGHPLFIALQ